MNRPDKPEDFADTVHEATILYEVEEAYWHPLNTLEINGFWKPENESSVEIIV